MEKLKTVLDVHFKHHGVLGYSLVTVLTAGLERIFSTAVFQCPCNATWNLAYGLVFLLVPALALFFLGYLLSARTGRLLTGCCAPCSCTCCARTGRLLTGCCAPCSCTCCSRTGRPLTGCCAPCSCTCCSRTGRPLTGCCAPCSCTCCSSTGRLLTGCCAPCSCTCGCSGALRGLLVLVQLSGMAAVAPLTWVAVALLGGDFYECAASGTQVLARRLCSGHRDPNCTALLPLVPCGDKQAKDVMGLQKDLKAQSQVTGWILIAAVITSLVIVVSITRCRSPVSFLQLKFWKIYLEREQKIFKNQATEHATKLAENNVKCFFECSHQKEEYKTPSVKDWEEISKLYTFDSKKLRYSTVHKFVNGEEGGKGEKEEETDKTKCCEGDSVVPVLHFVDSFALNTTLQL